jgi:hypothetical protein
MLASSKLSKQFLAGAFCVLLLGASSAVGAERNIEGTVFYKGGEPAADAAVELEDVATMQIISRRTDRDGHFRFMGLSQDKDYCVRALKKGYWSKKHTVSRFSSRSIETVTLYLVPGHKN